MIPVLSFALLRGKCFWCKQKFSPLYVIAELLTGLLFVSGAWYMQLLSSPTLMNWVVFFYLCVIFSIYIVIILSDLKYRIVPNRMSYTGIIIAFLFLTLTTAYILISMYFSLKNDDFGKYLLEAGFFNIRLALMLKTYLMNIVSSLLIAGFFWFLIVLTKGRGMGGGDVKLALLIGLFNTFPMNVLAIFIGFLSGAAVSLVMVLLRRKTLKDTIPFGPFLILGSLTAFFFGNQILNWYFSLM